VYQDMQAHFVEFLAYKIFPFHFYERCLFDLLIPALKFYDSLTAEQNVDEDLRISIADLKIYFRFQYT